MRYQGPPIPLTKLSVVFGDGHRLVKCPINARSTKESATRIVSSGGKVTTGTSSILLTNFDGTSMVVFFLYEPTSLANSSVSFGVEEEVPDPPSLGVIDSYIDLIQINLHHVYFTEVSLY